MASNSKLALFDSPEIISSLLYASSISSMLSLSISLEPENISVATIANTFLIVFLVFADWKNRVMVPLVAFPPYDLEIQRKPAYQFFKLVGEIISMVFLVVFYGYFIKNNYTTEKPICIYTIFACYLVACGIWNLIMIKIMQSIDLRPLIKGIFKGDIFDLPDLKNYTKSFMARMKKKEEDIEKEHLNTINSNPKKVKESARLVVSKDDKIQSVKNSARLMAQFIGNHIVWVNFFAAIIFLLKANDISFAFGEFNITIWEKVLIIKYIYFFYLGIVILFLYLGKLFFKMHIKMTRFGILLMLLMIVTYSIVGLKILVYIMILQQIFIGILIGNFTDEK